MDWPRNGGEFRLGDFQVQSGEVIRDARLVWKTYGTLTPEWDNVVLYPCSYGAKHDDMEWLIGSDGILDPTRWFIVIPNMFSNGVSSGPADSPYYPTLVTPWDNVHARHRLLTEQFGIDRLHAVYGFSMGAQRPGFESDQGSRPAVAGADRSLFSCCRQRVGKGPSRAYRVDADPEHLGPPRGQSRFDPRRRCLPEGGGPTLARINTASATAPTRPQAASREMSGFEEDRDLGKRLEILKEAVPSTAKAAF